MQAWIYQTFTFSLKYNDHNYDLYKFADTVQEKYF